MAPELSPEEFYSKHVDKRVENRDEEGVGAKFRSLRERFLSEVDGRKILDAGCGHGRDTDHFVEEGFEPVGIDIAPRMIEHARNNRKGEYRVMDMRNLEFGDGTFDGVWAPNTLYFMQRPGIETALEEFHRVLVPQGVLHAAFKKGDGEHEKERWGDSVIEYRFQDFQGRDMLEDASFRIVEKISSESPAGTVFLNYLCRKD